MDAVEIIAHRGASHEAPENSLSAVKLAWDECADAVEFDVRMTSDRRIVMIHDPDTLRLCGMPHEIAKSSWVDLQSLDIGAWKGLRFRGERIATLEDVLSTVPAHGRLYVEIKCGVEILPVLVETLASRPELNSRVTVISLSFEVVEAAKQLLPTVPVYWVIRLPATIDLAKIQNQAGQAVAAKLDGLDFGNTPALTAEAARIVTERGLRLCTWTVNDIEEAKRLIAMGVAGITTDFPAAMRSGLEVARPATAITSVGADDCIPATLRASQ